MIPASSMIVPVAALLLSVCGAHAQQLTVYTALESDLLPVYKASFEAANPGISINWVRDSTGVITAKLLAEKDNPRADVVLGTAATSLLLLKSEGMLEPFAPVGVETLDARFVDQDEPPYWVGTNAWAAALCVNTIEIEKAGVAIAQTQNLARELADGGDAMDQLIAAGHGAKDACVLGIDAVKRD